MECLRGRTLAIVDTETSGTSPYGSRIIEIGILRIEDGVCVESFETCLDPEGFVPEWIFNLTGIRPEELEGAPRFEDVSGTIHRLLEDAVFVAHNVGFDYAFLRAEFARAELLFDPKTLCSVRLSRMMNPRARRHNLSSIIKRHKLACPQRHRAMSDARAVWEFIQKMGEREPERLPAVFDYLLRSPRATRRAFYPAQAVYEPVIS